MLLLLALHCTLSTCPRCRFLFGIVRSNKISIDASRSRQGRVFSSSSCCSGSPRRSRSSPSGMFPNNSHPSSPSLACASPHWAGGVQHGAGRAYSRVCALGPSWTGTPTGDCKPDDVGRFGVSSSENFCLERGCSGRFQARIRHFDLELTVRSCTCWLLSATASQTSPSC